MKCKCKCYATKSFIEIELKLRTAPLKSDSIDLMSLMKNNEQLIVLRLERERRRNFSRGAVM